MSASTRKHTHAIGYAKISREVFSTANVLKELMEIFLQKGNVEQSRVQIQIHPQVTSCKCTAYYCTVNSFFMNMNKQIIYILGLIVGLGVGGATSLLILTLAGPFVVHKIKIRKMKDKCFKQNNGLLLQQLISRNTNISERMIITLGHRESYTQF